MATDAINGYKAGPQRSVPPKDIKETSTYYRFASNNLLKAILDGKRENMRTHAGGYYEFNAQNDRRVPESAIKILKEQFNSLGYIVGNLDEPVISVDVVAEFQKLCGIYEGNGQLIGKKTLEALITASEAKKGWKKAVAGLYDNKQLPSSKNITLLRQKLEGLQFVRQGINVTDIEPKMLELLQGAYSSLGLKTGGKYLRDANYKFQIISGVNEDYKLSNVYGPSTNKALVKALKAVEQNLNWRDQF